MATNTTTIFGTTFDNEPQKQVQVKITAESLYAFSHLTVDTLLNQDKPNQGWYLANLSFNDNFRAGPSDPKFDTSA